MSPHAVFSHLLPVRPVTIELLRPRRPVPPASWLLLAAGIAMFAGSAALLAPSLEERMRLGEQRASLEHRLDALQGAGPSLPLVRRSAALERDLQSQAQSVVLELHRPWHRLFDHLEGTMTPGVNIVQLDVESRFEEIQLVAESRDFPDLVRYTQRLASAPPVHSVGMTHHEWRDAAGSRVVDATMVARIDAGGEPRSGN